MTVQDVSTTPPEGTLYGDLCAVLRKHGLGTTHMQEEHHLTGLSSLGSPFMTHQPTGYVTIELSCFVLPKEKAPSKAMPYTRQRKYYDYGFANRGGCGEARRYEWKSPKWDDYDDLGRYSYSRQ